MGIYGNINRLTLLEYYISDETEQLNTMLPSLSSINEGNAWEAIKNVFGKIKKFFSILKEKIDVLIDKIKVFAAKIFSGDEHKPISTHYSFSGKEKELASKINIEYREFNIDLIIKDLKDNYLKEINDLWDSYLAVVDKRLNKSTYNEIKSKTEEINKSVDKFDELSKGLKDKYTKDSKEVSYPCTDGLAKAAIMHNNWFAGIKTIVHDLELHEKNLKNSIEDLEKYIKELENKISKNNGSPDFKDDLGNEVDLKDNCILLTKWEMQLNKIASSVAVSLSIISSISDEIGKISTKVSESLNKIKYHGAVAKNEKKENED